MTEIKTTSQAENPTENRKAFVDPATMPTFQTKRLTVPAAEALLGVPLRCLDKGFVRLVDYMGGDARVVQSARVSYGEGTKTRRDDAGLIDYLIRNAHTSPLEQIETVTHWKLPIFLARQFVRARTANLNEESARYSVLANEFWVPRPDELRAQSTTNKQMGGEPLEAEKAERILALIIKHQESDYALYEALLAEGLVREVSRGALPVTIYTEWYWKIDAHNLGHMLRLRDEPHAQPQAQVYARAMKEVLRAVAPMVYASMNEHLWGAVRFGRSERQALAELLKGNPTGLEGDRRERFEAKLFGAITPAPRGLLLDELGIEPAVVAYLFARNIAAGCDLADNFQREDLRRELGREAAERTFIACERAGLVLRGW